MRFWPYQLLSVLPVKQLVSQFRECAAVSAVLRNKGVTNHYIINRVMDYPDCHFRVYCNLVVEEMHRRNFKTGKPTLELLKIDDLPEYKLENTTIYINNEKLFAYWHDTRYINQCLYSFQEKYDCKGITEIQWDLLLTQCKYFTK